LPPEERRISYSQNGEDIVLARAFSDQAVGFYVDVGANHPVLDSVTKLFYDQGWHGINVEPLPALHSELRKQRPRDLNLNLGVAKRAGTMVFHEIPSAEGLSTFNQDLSNYYASEGRDVIAREVEVVPLQEIVDLHVDSPVDFLKVDVEGFEAEVLTSVDWSRFRPRVVVVEATNPEQWSTILLDAGYVMVQYDGINNFYVTDEEVESTGARLAVPATTVLDGYDPYHYVQQLDIAAQNIMALQSEVRDLEERLAQRPSPLQALLSPLRRHVARFTDSDA
jgi:FkbM family methyltransferase